MAEEKRQKENADGQESVGINLAKLTSADYATVMATD